MENENMAANAETVNVAASEPNTASSEERTTLASTSTEQTTAQVATEPVKTDVTETQAYSQRLNKDRDRIKSEIMADLEAKRQSEIQQSQSQNDFNSIAQSYIDVGFTEEQAIQLAEAITIAKETKQSKAMQEQQAQVKPQEDYAELNKIKAEFPEIFKGDKVVLPEGALKLIDGKDKVTDNPLEALRLNKLAEQQKVIDGFKAKESAASANAANAAASIGSVASGTAQEKDFYTSDEWDKLPMETRQKIMTTGKHKEWIKKW